MNIKDKDIEIENNKSHCGKYGHWLESKFKIKANSKNEPDLCGYEIKKSSSKISFGDFSASEYLFSNKRENIERINEWKKEEYKITRDDFIKYFGKQNPLKNNRYSWSGSSVPVYGRYNYNGQILEFNDNFDLCIYYSNDMDKRKNKDMFPDFMKNKIIIVIWKKKKLEEHINKKFNTKGFIICEKIDNKFKK